MAYNIQLLNKYSSPVLESALFLDLIIPRHVNALNQE